MQTRGRNMDSPTNADTDNHSYTYMMDSQSKIGDISGSDFKTVQVLSHHANNQVCQSQVATSYGRVAFSNGGMSDIEIFKKNLQGIDFNKM